MSYMTARTGAFAYARYGWETSFRAGASTRNIAFGRGVRVSSISANHNAELIYELGVREAQAWAFKQFEGSLSLEWIFSSPWIFKAVMGSVATTGTSPPYTHTYTKTKLPPSFEVEVGTQLSGASFARLFRGCFVNTLTLTASVNELLRASLEAYYAIEASRTAYGTALYDTMEPATFVSATLELPNGTVLGEVQSFELTINNNALRVFGLGSAYANSAVWQNFDATGRISITMKDASFLDMLRGSVSNGKFVVTTSSGTVTFNFSDLIFGEHTLSIEPNTLIVEDVPVLIRDIPSIVATNNTGTHP